MGVSMPQLRPYRRKSIHYGVDSTPRGSTLHVPPLSALGLAASRDGSFCMIRRAHAGTMIREYHSFLDMIRAPVLNCQQFIMYPKFRCAGVSHNANSIVRGGPRKLEYREIRIFRTQSLPAGADVTIGPGWLQSSTACWISRSQRRSGHTLGSKVEIGSAVGEGECRPSITGWHRSCRNLHNRNRSAGGLGWND